MRFSSSPETADIIGDACRRLGFPLSAEAWVQTAACGWANAGAIGAALIKDHVAHRAYFRSGIEAAGEIYGWGVEWSARKPLYTRKDYTLLAIDNAAAARPLIKAALNLNAASNEIEILDSWLELLEEVSPGFQLLKVSDRATGRISFDASPTYEQPVAFGDVRRFWEQWRAAFDVSADCQRAWIEDISSSIIENLTIGRDGKGELFVTIYFGKYDQPRPATEKPEIQTTAQRAGITSSSFHDATGARVFALGTIGIDLDWAKLKGLTDELSQAISSGNKAAIYQFLVEHPDAAPSLDWTLEINGRAIYCLCPRDEFGEETYAALIEFLGEQEMAPSRTERIERVSVPGYISGWRELSSGAIIPVLQPIARGMFSWSTAALLGSIEQPPPIGLGDFLARLYTEYKNLGFEPQDRALNYAATQPAVFSELFRFAAARRLGLQTIEARPHRMRGSGVEWWDVSLVFAPPASQPNLARWQAAITVDVSEPMPVFVSRMRVWEVE